MGMDVNNPYKRIGGGSLDQALFKKARPQPEANDPQLEAAIPTAKTSDDALASNARPVDTQELAKTSSRQALHDDGVRPNAPSPVRPNGKRIITRNSFEIFEDQMDSLRKLSFQEKMDGRLGSMSNMVREAIDEYLQKKTS
jgi:hypothetical protein